MASAFRPELHVGQVMHHRLRPTVHHFDYPVFYVRLPLSELADAAGGLFAVDRPGVLSFRTRDHGLRDGSPLLPWIRQHLRERGLPDDGEVVLQTFPRVFGYVFNPVSFWCCHDRSGALIAVLAAVSNTFGGHHDYLLHHPDGRPITATDSFVADKRFHVSPFFEVNGHYRFKFDFFGERPVVHIDYRDAHGDLLLTYLRGDQATAAWGFRPQAAALLRMPFMTLGVIARIHWQAFRLWRKGVPFFGKSVPQPFEELPQ